MSVNRIVLAPGASGTIDRLPPARDGLVARGFEVELVELPRSAPSVRCRSIGARSRRGTAWGAGHRRPLVRRPRRLAAGGGIRAGGRLILLSYPLHAPGRHDAWSDRTSHWPDIACPVLLLCGESDPFARLDLLRTAVTRLPDATLHTWPRVGHGLTPVLDEALDRVATFVRERT